MQRRHAQLKRRLTLRKLRHTLENGFWLIHLCIVEVTILILAAIKAWELVAHQ